MHGRFRPGRAIGLELAADAAPNVVGQHLLFPDQGFEDRDAGLRRLQKRLPEGSASSMAAASFPQTGLQVEANGFLFRD